MQHAKIRDVPGLILFCDWHKAYDSVDWGYLKSAVKAFGFGPDIQKWISLIYDSSEVTQGSACVQINGHLSERYIISRGLWQGCPLSCFLFLISLEPLLHAIRSCCDITGITIGDTEVKISAYADDTAIVMDGSERSLRECFRNLDTFREVAGLPLNTSKTRGFWIGQHCSRTDDICPEIPILWERGTVNYLGVKLNVTGEELGNINYPTKIDKLREKLNLWFGRGLTPYGKVQSLLIVAIHGVRPPGELGQLAPRV